MDLKELFKGVDYQGTLPQAQVSLVTQDSRKVAPGAVFVCTRGKSFDGHAYAKQALDKVKTDTDVAFLYVLDARITDNATYYIEGFNPATDFEEFDLQREGSFSCQQKETWTIKRDDGKRQKV